MAALRPLELAASLFGHAVEGGADVSALGESDLGLADHVQRVLAAPGALDAVRGHATKHTHNAHGSSRARAARRCRAWTRRARGWSSWRPAAWFASGAWCAGRRCAFLRRCLPTC